MVHGEALGRGLGTNKMSELEAQLSRHLGACRYYLPEHLPTEGAKESWARVEHHLHRRDFKGALDGAMALGNATDASQNYWRELLQAVRLLELDEHACKLAQLVKGQAGP